MRPIFLVAVVTLLGACAAQPPKAAPDQIPPDLIPSGFTAADCWIENPAETTTTSGPGGAPVNTGGRSPTVKCLRKGAATLETQTRQVCHTKSGKELPLSDCCLTETGEVIPKCTVKLQPPEE